MRTRVVFASMALAFVASCVSSPGSKGSPDGPPWPDEKQIDVGIGREHIWWGRPVIEVSEFETLAADNKAVVWSLRSSAAHFEFAGLDGIRFVEPSASLPLECKRKGDPEGFRRQVRSPRRRQAAQVQQAAFRAGHLLQVHGKLKPRAGGENLDRDPWIMNE